ncbi:hypothetical protein ABS768_05530 [Flavobacterium sp. ST-75]|uniref:Uncharacterized protein n=1 Tax=Flavobacterium rhizophilum TaxID=3163296 RepID=A0ABW8YAL2_9FLAO
MILFFFTSIENEAVLDSSIFSNYIVMIVMRWVAIIVIAACFIRYIGIPLQNVLYNFIERLLPNYNKRMKKLKKDNYEEYLAWAKSKGYEPVIEKKEI